MRIRSIGVLCVFFALVAMPAIAQTGDTPTFEVGAGYTFRPITFTQNTPAIDDSPATTTKTKLTTNGWNANLTYNFNSVWSVATSFDMTRNNPSSGPFTGTNDLYTLLVGPRIYPIGHHKITPYAHFEVGLGDFESITPSSTGCGTFENGPCNFTTASFALAFGGGLELSLTRALSLQLPEADFERSGFFEPGPGTGVENQNYYEVKAGVIVRFGQK